ncbi:helix-turn-helix domain-containing protein [Streptosporangium sp. 'caverna']|uniref:helix-turn-helix domain-containing protein n=1 Tax=Streptosporangium sp. 'caverna' TaxID=2202249 RepID=UPI0026D619E5
MKGDSGVGERAATYPLRAVAPAAGAARARSPPARTLTRQFTDQLGVPPARRLLERRLAATRALLEETDLPVETIATRVGLSSAVSLRRRFHTALRTTPAVCRRSFR